MRSRGGYHSSVVNPARLHQRGHGSLARGGFLFPSDNLFIHGKLSLWYDSPRQLPLLIPNLHKDRISRRDGPRVSHVQTRATKLVISAAMTEDKPFIYGIRTPHKMAWNERVDLWRRLPGVGHILARNRKGYGCTRTVPGRVA